MVTASVVEYISKRNHISWIDAYMLASLGCNLMFSQVVNPLENSEDESPKRTA